MINNVNVSQFIPPGDIHTVVGTWADAAGAVVGTIVRKKAANAGAETPVITIPIPLFSNKIALQGAKLMSIEVDYEVLVADCTSITAVLNKVTRGADLAVAVVAAVAFSQTPTAALAKVTDQHRLVITPTTPVWVSNNEYYLLQLTCVCPATNVMQFLGAFANYTFRM